MDNYYKAFNKEEICEFIENVVLNDIDSMKNQRDKFLKELRLNYPNVAQIIVEHIIREIVDVKI